MTYTMLNQERIKVSELEGRLAKIANYEALLQYNEDADTELYEVTAKAEGKCYQLFDIISWYIPEGA